jgi:protease IV
MKKGLLIALLVIILFVVFVALGVGYIYMQINKEPYVPENAFLKIDLTGTIVDSDISALSKDMSIRDLWYHLQRAKVDDRIKGVFLRVSGVSTGFAKLNDIGRMIKDFKSSGKPVYSFIESGGIGEYYVASFADKVYLFKGGLMMLNGLASEAMFLKNSLEKLGVQADFFHIGEYKTAGNMFTEDQMTPAHKESMEVLLKDVYDVTLESIAANRNIDKIAVRKVFNETPTSNDDYKKAGLVDDVIYEDEIFEGKEENGLRFVSFDIYKETTKPTPYHGMNRIAVIFASGEINTGESGGKSLMGGKILGSDSVAAQLRAARKNRFIKAVVLRIDSPGGSSVASDVIRREAELLAQKKPLVISMSDVAASGGYWISMSSEKIMALPQTITGSIGVISGKFVLKGLYDKVGITKEVVKTSQYADMFTDYRPFNDNERNKMNTMMNHMYDAFLQIVAQNRKMSKEDVDKVARGRVWAGKTAKKLKLIDQIGGFLDALNEAKKMAGFKPEQTFGVSIYPRKKSLMDMVMDLISGDSTISPALSVRSQIRKFQSLFPAYIMPYQISIR